MNILVFPCASGIGQEIFNALDMHKDINLYGMNNGDDNIGKYLYKNYVKAEYSINHSNFINYLETIIDKYKIDAIFPAYDDVQLYLKQYYRGKCKIITSNVETCELCRSKSKTYKFFDKLIKVPKMYDKSQIIDIFNAGNCVFIKPDTGEGSRGCYKIDNMNDFEQKYNKSRDIILEYLPGDEFTIDCLTDNEGKLLISKGRIRKMTRNGLSVITETCEIYNNKFTEIALLINSKLKFKGAWFFQVKQNIKNEFVLLEIAPRIAGAMSLYRQIGINFPLLSVYIEFGKSVNVNYINHSSLKCYKIYKNYIKHNFEYNNVYCDLDDTLIIKNKVNYKLLGVLYSQLNDGKKLYLITRHLYNPLDTLYKYKISSNMFDEIIWLNDRTVKKVDRMKMHSILIDDSFEERKHCKDTDYKYSLDVDSIDFLVN